MAAMKTLNIIKISFLLLVTSLFSIQANSQSLSAGDIAFIAYNADGGDDAAFVALADIPNGTSIYFTDNEWTGSAFNNTGEGTITWTATSTVVSGDIVVMTDLSAGISVNIGNISRSGSFNLGAKNECLWALSAPPAISYSETPIFYGLICNDIVNGDTTSGTGITLGVNGINFDNDWDGFLYTGSRSGEVLFSAYLPEIYDSSNWQQESSNGENILPVPTTAFTIGGASAGITLGAVSGNTSEDGTTATFTAVLDTAPTSNVVLDVSSDYPGEVSFDLSQLTFTDQNWDTPQTITITGLDDSDQDGDIDVTITVAVDAALSDDTYDGLSETITVTNEDNELPPLIINEFLAKPDVDVNGDGFYDFYDDEFVEVYNNTSNDLDISGYKLNDSGSTRHVFPSGSEIPAGEVIVVFGGGTPTNLPCITQIASNGGLYLNNSGDTISILDTSSVVVTSYSYGSEANSDQSLGRDLDITGDFKKHSEITGNPVDFSPGRYNETNIPFSAVTWSGTTNSDWATATNWSTGAVPTSSDIVAIDGTFTNEPSISGTDAVAKTVIVTSGNTLTIDESSSLTVSGDFTNTGTVTLNSTEDDFSSLIVTGTATGDITYNRYVNAYDTNPDGGGWDFVCSPVTMSIADFITANGAAGANVIEILGDDYAFASYDNAAGQWNLYATDTSTGSFTTGQGYAMATNAGDGATVAFTGAMQTTSQSIDIINNNGLNNVGRRWNLVSNPFPSYINGNTAAGTTNFMDANAAVIDDTFLYVYGWNGSSYTIYNQTTDAFSMAPGQAFWVAAENTTATALNFTAAMRTTTGTGDFVAGPQPLTYNVELILKDESQTATTNFYFKDGLSLDLDPGYDAGAYNQSMALSTRLPQGNQETAFSINAMDIDAMQNTRVPLEIRQNAGQAFTISMADMELPEDIYVYLEDTLNGTLTSLKDQDFELTAQNDLSGSDRFFIVFKSKSVLSSGDFLGIDALNVYKANTDSFVTIAGISPELEKLDITLYSILGAAVKQTVLNTTTATQRVSTQGLASGLYIVQIKSGNQTTVKKVIVQ
jgi:hypothetical protein